MHRELTKVIPVTNIGGRSPFIVSLLTLERPVVDLPLRWERLGEMSHEEGANRRGARFRERATYV